MLDLKFTDYTINKYTEIGEFYKGLARVKNNKGLYGFINKKGEEVISCQFKQADYFYEGLAAVKNNKGLYGFINEKGEEVIPCRFKEIKRFREGLAPVCNEEDKWGYINKKGELVISYQFEDAEVFNKGIGVVEKISGMGTCFIDKSGKIILDIEESNKANEIRNTLKRDEEIDGGEKISLLGNSFGYIICGVVADEDYKKRVFYFQGFNDGIALFSYFDKSYDQKFIYFNMNGDCSDEYISASDFDTNGYALVCDSNNKALIINKEFGLVQDLSIKLKYRNLFIGEGKVNGIMDGFITLKSTDNGLRLRQSVFCNLYLDEIYRTRPGYNFSYYKGYLYFETKTYIGFHRISDSYRIKLSKEKYNCIEKIYEGLAAVENVDGLWGFINEEGQEVIPCRFKKVGHFSEGLCNVEDLENNSYYIDENGEKAFEMPISYCSILEADGYVEFDPSLVEYYQKPREEFYEYIPFVADNESELCEGKLKVLSAIRQLLINGCNGAYDNALLLEEVDDAAYPYVRELKMKG